MYENKKLVNVYTNSFLAQNSTARRRALMKSSNSVSPRCGSAVNVVPVVVGGTLYIRTPSGTILTTISKKSKREEESSKEIECAAANK